MTTTDKEVVRFDQWTAIRRSAIEAVKKHEGKVFVHTGNKFYEVQCGYDSAVRRWTTPLAAAGSSAGEGGKADP